MSNAIISNGRGLQVTPQVSTCRAVVSTEQLFQAATNPLRSPAPSAVNSPILNRGVRGGAQRNALRKQEVIGMCYTVIVVPSNFVNENPLNVSL